MDGGGHAAALQGTGDDQALDLAGPLPDAVHAKLPQQPLRNVAAPEPTTAEDLDRPVGAAPGCLAREELGHRGLGVDELRVRPGVDKPGDLEREQAGGGRVCGRVGEREGHPLIVEDPLAALDPVQRPLSGLVEQAPHGTDTASGDRQPLLDEPGTLELLSRPDLTEDVIVRYVDVGEPEGGMAVRVVVRERGLVDHLDAWTVRVDDEQRREPAVAVDRVRHADMSARHVTARHEPLLTVDQPAPVGLGGRGAYRRWV